jgi:hypothetical protein
MDDFPLRGPLVYVIGSPVDGAVKVGFTVNLVDVRLKALQTGSPVVLAVLGWMRCPSDFMGIKIRKSRPMAFEKLLHAHLESLGLRSHGEWFHRPAMDEVMSIAMELRVPHWSLASGYTGGGGRPVEMHPDPPAPPRPTIEEMGAELKRLRGRGRGRRG